MSWSLVVPWKTSFCYEYRWLRSAFRLSCRLSRDPKPIEVSLHSDLPRPLANRPLTQTEHKTVRNLVIMLNFLPHSANKTAYEEVKSRLDKNLRRPSHGDVLALQPNYRFIVANRGLETLCVLTSMIFGSVNGLVSLSFPRVLGLKASTSGFGIGVSGDLGLQPLRPTEGEVRGLDYEARGWDV